MSEVMLKTSERVKTLSIIDTISELARNENEASRLTLPSPIHSNNQNNSSNKSPRKYPSSTNISGHISLGHFQNGVNTPKSPEINMSSPRKTNDTSGQRILPPPLISPSSHGLKSSPRTPNFTLYEIDQQRNNFEFMSSTPTSPQLNLSHRSKGTPLSPFAGGARSKLGSLRIIKGASRDLTNEQKSTAKQSESDEVRLRPNATYKNISNSNGNLKPHNVSDQKPYPAQIKATGKQFSPQSVLFGTKHQQPFVTLDSSGGKIETKNGKVQTPDWIRDIFLHAKRGSREKLVRCLAI